MKTTKILTLAALATFIALCRTTQAGLVLGPTTVGLPGSTGGPAALSVENFVTLCGGTYAYYFALTPTPGSYGVGSYTVNIADTAIVSDVASTSPACVPSPVVDNDMSLIWNFNSLLTGGASDFFQSQDGSGDTGMSSATSINGSWVDSPPAIAGTESSAVVAGLLMVLPLTAGIFRTLHKSRDINDLRLAAVPRLSSQVWANVPNGSQVVPTAGRRESLR